MPFIPIPGGKDLPSHLPGGAEHQTLFSRCQGNPAVSGDRRGEVTITVTLLGSQRDIFVFPGSLGNQTLPFLTSTCLQDDPREKEEKKSKIYSGFLPFTFSSRSFSARSLMFISSNKPIATSIAASLL